MNTGLVDSIGKLSIEVVAILTLAYMVWIQGKGHEKMSHSIDKLTHELEIMKGWAKLAQANGEDKLKYLNIIREALCALESTPYWDRSGNCETAIDILKKTSE